MISVVESKSRGRYRLIFIFRARIESRAGRGLAAEIAGLALAPDFGGRGPAGARALRVQ